MIKIVWYKFMQLESELHNLKNSLAELSIKFYGKVCMLYLMQGIRVDYHLRVRNLPQCPWLLLNFISVIPSQLALNDMYCSPHTLLEANSMKSIMKV